MFEDMKLDMTVYVMFNRGMRELDYIQNTLEFLEESLSAKLDDLENSFSNDINSLYLDEYENLGSGDNPLLSPRSHVARGNTY